jgi:hypothetical protein
MPSREEILAVYPRTPAPTPLGVGVHVVGRCQSGPDAVVALVEQLLATHAGQMEQWVNTCDRQVADLSARIEQSEARLNQDSHPHLRFGQV